MITRGGYTVIGEKIRNIRNERGLTIKELADKINVSSGYISQIERDLVEPSLTILRNIAKELGVTLAALFSEDTHGGVVQIPLGKRTKIKFADINMEYEFLTPSARNRDIAPNMEVIFFKLSPKSWGSREVMLHEADECVIVLEGVLEYHIDDKVYTVEKGGSIYIPSHTCHYLYNPDEHVEVEAFGIISPPVF